MRRIEVIFSGNAEAEKEVADTIQQKVFDIMGNKRIDVKAFSNMQVSMQQVSMQQGKNLMNTEKKSIEVPEFLHSNKTPE